MLDPSSGILTLQGCPPKDPDSRLANETSKRIYFVFAQTGSSTQADRRSPRQQLQAFLKGKIHRIILMHMALFDWLG